MTTGRLASVLMMFAGSESGDRRALHRAAEAHRDEEVELALDAARADLATRSTADLEALAEQRGIGTGPRWLLVERLAAAQALDPEALTAAQRDGVACLRCAGEAGAMQPAGRVDGYQVFAHDECPTTLTSADYRARARDRRQLLERAVTLGRAIERVRLIHTYALDRGSDAERERCERLDAVAIGQARGHVARLALDVLPPAGYEVG